FERLEETGSGEAPILFLALIAAQKGNLEGCLRCLDRVLEYRNFSEHIQLNSLEELAAFLIGLKKSFEEEGKKDCARLSLEIAREVYPDPVFIEDLIRNGRKVSVERVLNLLQRGSGLGIKYEEAFLSRVEDWIKEQLAQGSH
ncbi:hypothetical protein, partial [Thermosulfuriphilus sp.]